MKTFFKFLDNLVESLGILVTCALIIIAFVQVFWRYVLGNALSWTEETSLMLFLWMSYIGVTMAMKDDAHLRVDAFIMVLPERGRRIMHIICLAGAVLLCAAIAYMSFNTTMKIMSRGQTAISIFLPIWYVWLGIPFSFALTTLQAARRLWLAITTSEN